MEFLLNTEAALQDLNIHFEILNLTHRGKGLSSYAYDEVPALVKKYDIDLVLGLADSTGYSDYYTKPMSDKGVPIKAMDPEYMLKPLSQRIPSGAAADLIERCKKLKIPISEKTECPGDGLYSLLSTGDAQLLDDLKEMTARRLQLLQENLNSMKTSGGYCPQLVIFYVPCPLVPNAGESFWNDTCAQYHLKFLDLSESYNALKFSYYPTNATHYSVYGNELIARLLERYLIKNKYIPFGPDPPFQLH